MYLKPLIPSIINITSLDWNSMYLLSFNFAIEGISLLSITFSFSCPVFNYLVTLTHHLSIYIQLRLYYFFHKNSISSISSMFNIFLYILKTNKGLLQLRN